MSIRSSRAWCQEHWHSQWHAGGITSGGASFSNTETSYSRDTFWYVECVAYTPTSVSGLYTTEAKSYAEWSYSAQFDVNSSWIRYFTNGQDTSESDLSYLAEGSGWSKTTDNEWGVLGNSGVTGTYRVVEEGHEDCDVTSPIYGPGPVGVGPCQGTWPPRWRCLRIAADISLNTRRSLAIRSVVSCGSRSRL